MVFPDNTKLNTYKEDDPIVVPLAIPLIAGPSSMAVVILFSTQYPDKIFHWVIALSIAWVACFLVLLLLL